MKKLACPCCGYRTMEGDGNYEICPICFWEDDPFQKENVYSLGANHIPLIEAQLNYIKYGVSEKEFIKNVRKPTNEDKRDPNWKPVDDNMYEVKLACRKFIEGRYGVEELSGSFSLIGVPIEIAELIKQAEYDLEMIRFCTTDYKQRDEALIVVNNLLKKLNIEIVEEEE
ncbi:hypothetical protein FZW96_20930 [Bacillus sp. BGMRC 2118]|nr:hypothetical protein FZW96_20930 [Bacillus sp. BGMRC 2118]